MDLAASRAEPIPVFAEMGSINPVVISSLALKKNAEKWAEIYAQSITLGTGQFCTNPGLVILLNGDDAEAFIAAVAERFRTSAAGTLPAVA